MQTQSLLAVIIVLFLLFLLLGSRNLEVSDERHGTEQGSSSSTSGPELAEVVMRSGTPTIAEYEAFLKSPYFRNMESFADRWRTSHRVPLLRYQVVRDSFHWWSRVWEYPYVVSKALEHLKAFQSPWVLDLGSGVTFLPYLLKRKVPKLTAVACDVTDYRSVFTEINKEEGEAEDFVQFEKVPVTTRGRKFDMLICVSVLEHVQQPELDKVLSEVNQLLRVGGIFIVTFDVEENKHNNPGFLPPSCLRTCLPTISCSCCTRFTCFHPDHNGPS